MFSIVEGEYGDEINIKHSYYRGVSFFFKRAGLINYWHHFTYFYWFCGEGEFNIYSARKEVSYCTSTGYFLERNDVVCNLINRLKPMRFERLKAKRCSSADI